MLRDLHCAQWFPHLFRRSALRGCTLALLAIVTLSGCATSAKLKEYIPSFSDDRDYASLYLRGVFNWWEAEPAYQFTEQGSAYVVDVELIADGQPYDFKVADAVYSSEHHCGALASLGVLAVENTFTLHCSDTAYNLQFTPAMTGTYRFTLRPGHSPSITISRI